MSGLEWLFCVGLLSSGEHDFLLHMSQGQDSTFAFEKIAFSCFIPQILIPNV
ncbi:hypothetical protein M407DRAFT_245295 [Tulasnella calospora MUT 4182]|uniref:Uncharacterized protein n=1 Tax=Tulasnella calospora MUT 4182 TaxID=1051891 RepID=A0A0C3QC25_9AGAM|nr:hypothetical protein M407DRAFT_245551 [Tulasnella calospora MUT 4182]KIO22029.1 hypothetical protein M407DRAFT_245295 [Tulasnella calospora MUT 4182]